MEKGIIIDHYEATKAVVVTYFNCNVGPRVETFRSDFGFAILCGDRYVNIFELTETSRKEIATFPREETIIFKRK